MANSRWVWVSGLVLAFASAHPAVAQTVVSTHSGLVYFFEGSAYLEDQPLQQQFGRFPDIGQGHVLRTEKGRAEVLLTPGVFLRIDDNTAIRMISTELTDTRVELLHGSAIVESSGQGPDNSVRITYKSWQMRLPEAGVYRIDSDPPQVQAYQGALEVSADGQAEPVTVHEGDRIPLAPVLVTESAPVSGNDAFKTWAMNRSQAISSDNTVAAQILDNPSAVDATGLALGGFTYFPLTGIPSLGIGNPYGLSFWSPYQSTLTLAPSPLYGPGYGGWPGRIFTLYPNQVGFPLGIRPSGIGYPGYRTGLRPIGVPPAGTRPYSPPTRPTPVFGRPGIGGPGRIGGPAGGFHGGGHR
jgi:hypothetical protein